MSSVGQKTHKDSKYYIWQIFIVVFINFTFLSIQATNVLYFEVLGIENKHIIKGYTPDAKKNAILTSWDTDTEVHKPIQFISQGTEFKFDQEDVKFPLEYQSFLNKINTHNLTHTNNKYNHMCLSLYVIYENEDKLEVVESPLFAKNNVEKFLLTNEGFLQQKVTVEFSTKINGDTNDDTLAYFTTHFGESEHLENDPEIFPISSSSYECKPLGCNAVCKEFYHDADGCQCLDSACRHTEPHALFHVRKHAGKLFAPLITKAKGINNVKSIGIRFFSHYQPCNKCVEILNNNRCITWDGDSKELSLIFYFKKNYGRLVLAINGNKLDLINYSSQYLSPGYLSENRIYEDPDLSSKLGDVLGYIQLEEEINLSNNNNILLIQNTDSDNIKEKYKIYYH